MSGTNQLATKTFVNGNDLKDEIYQIAWSGCKLTFLSHVQELRRNILLCDCKIVAGGRAFFAHKAVLASASSLLRKLLEEDKSEQTTLILTGVSASDLCALLEYIYSGFVKVSVKQLSSLLMVAQSLGITSLEKHQLNDGNQAGEFIAPNPFDDEEMHTTVASEQIESEGDEIPNISENISNDRKRLQPLTEDEIAWAQRFYCPSELPAKCPFCHVTIKQGRNMARHLSLKHNIDVKPKMAKTKLKSSKNPKHEINSEIVHILHTVSSEETVITSPEDERKPLQNK